MALILMPVPLKARSPILVTDAGMTRALDAARVAMGLTVPATVMLVRLSQPLKASAAISVSSPLTSTLSRLVQPAKVLGENAAYSFILSIFAKKYFSSNYGQLHNSTR